MHSLLKTSILASFLVAAVFAGSSGTAFAQTSTSSTLFSMKITTSTVATSTDDDIYTNDTTDEPQILAEAEGKLMLLKNELEAKIRALRLEYQVKIEALRKELYAKKDAFIQKRDATRARIHAEQRTKKDTAAATLN